MKKLFFGLMVMLMGAAGANAQLLWRVTGPNVKDATYLFGTHHLAPVSMLDSVAGFAPALAAVDAVAGEVDMQSATDPQVMSAVAAVMMAPTDSLLTDVLGPERTDSLNTVLARYTGGMLTADALKQVKPAVVASQLALLTAPIPPEQVQKIAAGEQLDTQVQTLGRQAKKQVLGFETLQQQVDILMGNPIAEQAEQLAATVRQCISGEAQQMGARLYNAYVSQNLPEIEQIMLNEGDMTPEQLQRLITDRNRAWAAELVEWMPRRSMMVAVGCGHLPGTDGLIELLRAAGYTVTPVTE